MFKFQFKKKSIFFFIFFLIFSCGIYKPTDTRKTPVEADQRARKNIEEGRGISVGNVLKRSGTNYEFSTSNPLWRASLETLDFLPLTTVDYSGGILITDWYSDNSANQSLKITIRFLSNEVRSDSLKIIIHEKNCTINQNCDVKILDSKIKNELIQVIIKKAALLEADTKKK